MFDQLFINHSCLYIDVYLGVHFIVLDFKTLIVIIMAKHDVLVIPVLHNYFKHMNDIIVNFSLFQSVSSFSFSQNFMYDTI